MWKWLVKMGKVLRGQKQGVVKDLRGFNKSPYNKPVKIGKINREVKIICRKCGNVQRASNKSRCHLLELCSRHVPIMGV